MKKYLTLLAGAMFLTACYNDAEDIAGKDGYQPSTNAIAFEVNEDGVENATRASGMVFDDATLQTKAIGVFASYTGKLKYENTTVSPDFMYNQKLAYDGTGSAWTYAPLKYWPNGLAETPEYLSFLAYKVIILALYKRRAQAREGQGSRGCSRRRQVHHRYQRQQPHWRPLDQLPLSQESVGCLGFQQC